MPSLTLDALFFLEKAITGAVSGNTDCGRK
jgi:hypothetical protein